MLFAAWFLIRDRVHLGLPWCLQFSRPLQFSVGVSEPETFLSLGCSINCFVHGGHQLCDSQSSSPFVVEITFTTLNNNWKTAGDFKSYKDLYFLQEIGCSHISQSLIWKGTDFSFLPSLYTLNTSWSVSKDRLGLP